jgi:drug/metabolite transporter (DMT)-like permease
MLSLNAPFANVFLFSLFWAFQIFVSKLAFVSGAKPGSFTVQSAVATLLIMSVYVLPFKSKELKSISSKIFWGLMAANTIHFAIGGFASSIGISLTTAINAGFLVKFALVTTIFFAWLILGEKLTKSKLITAAVMLIGVYFLSTKGQLIIPHIGDLFIISACFAWSFGNVLIRKILKGNNVSPEIVSFLRPIVGLPLLLIFIWLQPVYPASIRNVFDSEFFDFTYLPYVFANGLFGALLSVFLNRTLAVASASYMTMMSMMTPVMTTLLAMAFLKETMVTPQIIGAVLIIMSGVITHYLRVDKH